MHFRHACSMRMVQPTACMGMAFCHGSAERQEHLDETSALDPCCYLLCPLTCCTWNVQEHAERYATALQEALAAAARPATQPVGRPKKRQRAAKAPEAVRQEADATTEPAPQAATAEAAAGAAQPALEHALVDDAVYLQHVQHAAMRDRNQHVTRHAVEDAIHGGEAAALLQARAPPPAALLRMYGAPHDQLIADRCGALQALSKACCPPVLETSPATLCRCWSSSDAEAFELHGLDT